eukprot:scaffold39498_cov56-Attheya_sp.AAC.5
MEPPKPPPGRMACAASPMIVTRPTPPHPCPSSSCEGGSTVLISNESCTSSDGANSNMARTMASVSASSGSVRCGSKTWSG